MPIYVATLREADYVQFREKDPTLPETYKAWEEQTVARVQAMRRRGEDPMLYQIYFDAFVERNGMLGIPDFDQVTRDDYADEVVHANAITFRL